MIVSTAIKAALGFVFDNTLGKVLAITAGVLALIGWFALEQQSIGAIKEQAKQGRKDHAAASNIRDAERASRGNQSRGVRDPNSASE